MSFAKIQPITDRLSCQAGETVECAFDVFNTTNQTVKVGVEPMGDLAESSRVSIKGASEIELQANGQEKVIVTIAPSDDGGAETSSFSLRVYNVRDTEQTVESKAVAIEVEATAEVVEPVAEKKSGPNWGLIIGGVVGGLVLLIGGGIGIYFLVSGDGGVPDVMYMTSSEAEDALANKDLVAVIARTSDVEEGVDPGTIVDQDPAAGEDLPEDGKVRLKMAGEVVASNPKTCENAVQGKIAWNYSGTTSWSAQNVANLCKGAEGSTGPAKCFNTVMHGGVNHGSSTQWQWQNALNLCKGATNANSRVQCFKSRIAAGNNWQQAISGCTLTAMVLRPELLVPSISIQNQR